MTDDEKFDDIASAITNSSAWHGAVQQARTEVHRQNPGGVDLARIGHAAWAKLTPIQQARALPDLFTAYIVRLYEEEREQQLAKAVREQRSYLEPDDEHLLADSLSAVDFTDEAAQVDGVCASALSNLLSEVDLLRHRLNMAQTDGTASR
jgi:hypothetical protein